MTFSLMTRRQAQPPSRRSRVRGVSPQKDCSLGVYALDVNHVQDQELTQELRNAPAKLMVLCKAPRKVTQVLRSESSSAVFAAEPKQLSSWVVRRRSPQDNCVCVAVRYDDRSERDAGIAAPWPPPPVRARGGRWRSVLAVFVPAFSLPFHRFAACRRRCLGPVEGTWGGARPCNRTGHPKAAFRHATADVTTSLHYCQPRHHAMQPPS